MGVSTSPAQSCRCRSTPSRRVDDVPASLQSSKVPAHRNLLLVHSRTTAQRHKALQSHSLKSYPLHDTLQSVLRSKDMNTKLLDGLEMFLGVFVTSLNSSKLQMAGGWHIYRPPSRSSCLEPLPNFLRMHRCIRRYSTGASGHSVPEGIRWEL